MTVFDIAFSIIGTLLFLIVASYLIKLLNTKTSESKVSKLQNDFDLKFFKILKKKCSIKRLNSEYTIVDKHFVFDECNLLVEKDFIIIQGITLHIFNSIVINFIITENPKKLKSTIYDWKVYKPEIIEFNVNKTEVKIVFESDGFNISKYSLIISNLSNSEFEQIEKMKNYC